jgi:hypothetical protein
MMMKLKKVLQICSDVPFNRFKIIVGKLQHAASGVLVGKSCLGPINRLIGIQPTKVVCDQAPDAEQARRDCRQLSHTCVKEPTNGKELGPWGT